jgi:hypothetical protein
MHTVSDNDQIFVDYSTVREGHGTRVDVDVNDV